MLFDFNAPQNNSYGNDFSATEYARDSRWFNKQKNIQDAARPWWQAALQFIPFGIGNLISPAIDAGINKGRNVYQHRLDEMAASAGQQAFDYGFDDKGQFYATQRTVPVIDNPGAEDAAIAAGVGGAVKGAASSISQGLGRDTFPSDGGPYNSMSNSSGSAVNPAPANTEIVTNPSAGNMDWNSAWNNPDAQFQPVGYKKGGVMYKSGGVMVTGGEKGEDDIALVNAKTGEDTGKRVSSGEKIVFSEETLAALGKALKSKNKNTVFKLVKEQIAKKPNEDGGLAGGGTIDITPGYGNMDWTFGWGGGVLPEDNVYYTPPGTVYSKPATSARPVFVSTPPKSRNAFSNASYWLPSAAGSAYDSMRLAEGLIGADTTIPTWHKPSNWVDYVNRMNQASQSGYDPSERALFRTEQDRQALADMANIYNLSAGSNAIALANLGRSNYSQYLANLNFAAQDAAQKRANMAAYGSVLGQDVNLDRMIFGDRYTEAKQKEAAGAKLANDAINNIKGRALVDQYYGPNSMQGKATAQQLAAAEETQAQQKAFMKFLLDNPDEWSKFSVGSSAGAIDTPAATTKTGEMYDEYRNGGGKLSYAEFIKLK